MGTSYKHFSQNTQEKYIKAYQVSTKMETIINNPGLQHLAEKVFLNLDVEDLKNCEHINQSCKKILENPMFWLKKFGGSLSEKNEKDWVKIIQSVKNSDHEKIIVFYLRWVLKNAVETVDLPFSWFLKFRRVPYYDHAEWTSGSSRPRRNYSHYL